MILKTKNDLLSSEESLTSSLKRRIAAFGRAQQRSQMAALHECGIDVKPISLFVNRHITTVRRWIARAKNDGDIHDQKRKGRPAVYPEQIRLKTIAFYCQVSPLPGCGTWSFRWAEKYLKNHSEIIDCSMSHSTIQRILKSHAIRPHLNKYFLAITDPDFFPKMDHIINLNLNPPEYLFNFDECTGIQATNPLAPILPASENKPRYEDPSYSRNGTTDLLAFLNPKTGKVFGRCCANHNTQTLVRVFKEHVYTLPPDALLHYIMDNLSTHFHNDFCATVAELSKVAYVPLKTGIERRQWLQSDHKRIVIHFVPFHGSWLNMIEIWFGILYKRFLKHHPHRSDLFLAETISKSIEMWNDVFAHPFTWKYTGEGLHEKVIARFNKQLIIENRQMDIKFLTKQLLLMSNIFHTYPHKAQTEEWKQLCDLVGEKRDYLYSIINSDTKESRIDKAHQAFDRLNAILL